MPVRGKVRRFPVRSNLIWSNNAGIDHQCICWARVSGYPARLQEAGKVAALAQLGDAQLAGPGAGLSVTIAMAVALGQPFGALLALAGAGPDPSPDPRIPKKTKSVRRFDRDGE